MKTNNVEFVNRRGLELSGYLDLPDSTPVRSYAILAHCFTCGKDLKPFVNMNLALTSRGIAVLRFDFTGLGESDGDFSSSTLSSNIEDLVDAAGFLNTNYGAPALLIGHSLGGVAVLNAVRHIESVTAVATVAAPFDPAHLGGKLSRAREEAAEKGEARVTIGGRQFDLRESFFKDLETTPAADVIESLDIALLVLHSPADTIVEIDNAGRIFAAARHPKSFVSLADADHLMLKESDASYVGGVIAAWAENYI